MRVKVTPATLGGQDLPAQMVEFELKDDFKVVGVYELEKVPKKCWLTGMELEWLSADSKFPKVRFVPTNGGGRQLHKGDGLSYTITISPLG